MSKNSSPNVSDELTASAVILAAGSSKRMGYQHTGKPYLRVAGKSLLSYSLEAFKSSPFINEIIIVVARKEIPTANAIVQACRVSAKIVPGGKRRQDSSLAGITAASSDFVLIHDAARPFVTQTTIINVLEGAKLAEACVPVVSVTDTLRYAEDSMLTNSIDRRNLFHIQTPQGFRRRLLLKLLPKCQATVTDDAEAFLSNGRKVKTTPGSVRNIKITTPADLEYAELLATTDNLLT